MRQLQDKIKEVGLPDVIQVRKVFDDKEKARSWEHRVLRRLRVRTNDKWLNKTDNKSYPILKGEDHPMFGRTGDKHPLFGVDREDISQSRKEKGMWKGSDNPMYDPEQKRKSIASRSGNNHHMKRKEVKEKVSGQNNYIHKDPVAFEKRMKQMEILNSRRKPCPYCGREMTLSSYGRHVKNHEKNL